MRRWRRQNGIRWNVSCIEQWAQLERRRLDLHRVCVGAKLGRPERNATVEGIAVDTQKGARKGNCGETRILRKSTGSYDCQTFPVDYDRLKIGTTEESLLSNLYHGGWYRD